MIGTRSVLSEERQGKIDEQFAEAMARAKRMDNRLDIAHEELNKTLARTMALNAKSGVGSSKRTITGQGKKWLKNRQCKR